MSKNYIEEPANIKSVLELAVRLEAGEVFYGESGCKYWFDASMCNPFRLEDHGLNRNWDQFASLKTRREINWWEAEGALPALCVVNDNETNPCAEKFPIAIVVAASENYFIDATGKSWTQAVALSISDIDKYIKA